MRPETGIMKFGDDWPGIFIRGDNAAMYSHAIRSWMKNPDDVISGMYVKGLADLLVSCVRNSNPLMSDCGPPTEDVQEARLVTNDTATVEE